MILKNRTWWIAMAADSNFVKSLGQRIAQLRKMQNMTQKEAGKALGISQQAFARYEVGLRRIPIDMLPLLAGALDTTIDQLLGVDNGKSKPGPSSKLEKYLAKVKALSKNEQQFVIKFLNTFLENSEESQQ